MKKEKTVVPDSPVGGLEEEGMGARKIM